MESGNIQSRYAARVIADPLLETTAIELSYTDLEQPAHNLAIRVAPDLGSNLYSYKVGEHELIHCEFEKLKQRGHTGVFVLWPFPNRVRDKEYTYRGQHYSLRDVPRHNGDIIHGLVYDRSWQYELPVSDEQAAMVTTFVEMTPDSPYYASFPFPSRLSLTYTLNSSGVTVAYTVENKGTQTLPYGFALHPYLQPLSGKERTLVTLPANALMEADDRLLPTGRLLDVHSTMYAMFDLNQPEAISQLKLDHVYTNLPQPPEVRVDYEGLDLNLHISASEDFTHAVIYTPGDPYFCLENQTCSTDAINLAAQNLQGIAHLLEVQPGARVSGFIRYNVQ